MPKSTLKFRAFLSYSHADDIAARWLHKSLESYRFDKDLVGRQTTMGIVPATLSPIFKDREDFTAGSALVEQTLTALSESSALIVLCSPASAKSRYVNEEIRLFRSTFPSRPVIPVIVSGGKGELEQECFPPALRFELQSDGALSPKPLSILAADIRETADGRDLALAKVVARLTGVETDEVFRRAQRAVRLRQRNWMAGLSTVAGALAILAIWAEFNRQEAVAQRSAADQNFAAAKQAADSLVFEIARDLREVEGMRTETVRKILGRAEVTYDKLVQSTNKTSGILRGQAAMLNELSKTYESQGDAAKQLETALASKAIIERLAYANPDAPTAKSDFSASQHRIGDALMSAGRLSAAIEAYQSSLKVIATEAQSKPERPELRRMLALVHSKIGDALKAQGNFMGSYAAYENSLHATINLNDRYPDNLEVRRDMGVSHLKFGDLLREQGQPRGAAINYDMATNIFFKLSTIDLGNTQWQRDLAIVTERIAEVQLKEGDIVAAHKSFAKWLTLTQHLASADPSNALWQIDYARALATNGKLLIDIGETKEAVSLHERGLELVKTAAARHPGNPDLQHQLAILYTGVSSARIAAGDTQGSLATARSSIAAIRPLLEIDRSNMKYATTLARAHSTVGDALSASNDRAAAQASYEAARKICELQALASPRNSDLQQEFFQVLRKIGEHFIKWGDTSGAEESFNHAVTIAHAWSKANPDDIRWGRNSALISQSLSNVHRLQGSLSKSKRELLVALETLKRLAERRPNDLTLRDPTVTVLRGLLEVDPASQRTYAQAIVGALRALPPEQKLNPQQRQWLTEAEAVAVK